MSRILTVLMMTVVAVAAGMENGPVVEIDSGLVLGVARDKSAFFKGIPFAAPPTGENRFRPPQPVKRWGRLVYNATQFKRSCYQTEAMGYPQPPDTLSEDCLYLNVYSPPIPADSEWSGSLLPVIFWIYGGGYQGGGGNETRLNGTWDVELYESQVVIVTSNYRDNIFGFLAAEEFRDRDPNGSTGNYGIQDQREAMAWVHRNIAKFGGDPNRVLIVGQSAGAHSVSQHLVRNQSWPYFSAAGMESGPFYDSYTLTQGVNTVKDVRGNFLTVLRKLGCASDPASYVSCLLKKTTTEIYKAKGGIKWYPVVDGVELIAPGPVLADRGHLAKVPVFAGYVSEDIDTMSIRCRCGKAGCTQKDFVTCAKAAYHVSDADAVELANLYSDEVVPPGARGTKWFWAMKHAGADNWAGCPAHRIMQWFTKIGQQAFYYRWSHTPINHADGGSPGHAHHACEQPFVFHVLSETAEELREDKGKYFIDPKDEPLSHAIVQYWLSMARDGKPSPGNTIGVDWPAWSNATGAGLVIGDNDNYTTAAITVRPHLRSAKCAWFDRIFRQKDVHSRTATLGAI